MMVGRHDHQCSSCAMMWPCDTRPNKCRIHHRDLCPQCAREAYDRLKEELQKLMTEIELATGDPLAVVKNLKEAREEIERQKTLVSGLTTTITIALQALNVPKVDPQRVVDILLTGVDRKKPGG